MKKILLSFCLLISVISNGQFFAAQQANDDYDAFQLINTAPLTVTINRDAINILAKGFKVYGLWTLSKAIYPLVGGTASICKWNLKDVRDLDAAYRLTFAASPTFTSDGVDWNGTTQYADTKFVATSFTNTNATIAYYSRENVSESKSDMGSYDGTNIVRIISLYASNSSTYGEINSGGGGTAAGVTDTRGLFTATRTGSSANVVYRNATAVASPNTAETARPATYSIYIGTLNASGTATGFSTKQCAFALIYDGGMTATQVANMYGVVQAFQTKLGRQL